MFGFLKPDPRKQLKKDHQRLTSAAFEAQRNGDIRRYSELTAQAEATKAELDALLSGTPDD